MAKILICDDAKFMCETIREALESGGHEVVATAPSGKEGVALYQKLKPDLVTMDILMEDSGLDAVIALMKLDPKIKIIVVSVLGEQEGEVVEAIRAGALGIVAKPIHKKLLLAEVDRVLKKGV